MTMEYNVARNHAALIDLAAEGRFRITGDDAETALNAVFSMDLEIVLPWKGVTGLFLDEQAGIRAFATVFKGDDEFYVFTEAATAKSLHALLVEQLAASGVAVEDLSEQFGWLCVVGPKAQNAMSEIAGEDVLGLPYLAFEDNVKLESRLFRMGFTGEFEYRVLCSNERLEEIRGSILAGGGDFELAEVSPEVLGLLMLEMRSLGIADIAAGIDPIQAGLHWMVSFRKDAYPGRDAVIQAKSNPARRALMLRLSAPGAAAAGNSLSIEGRVVGEIARVAYSPALESDIGLAFVDADFGWVGVVFAVNDGSCLAMGVSAPLFVTKTVSGA